MTRGNVATPVTTADHGLCPACVGSGALRDDDGAYFACPACRGVGWTTPATREGPPRGEEVLCD